MFSFHKKSLMLVLLLILFSHFVFAFGVNDNIRHPISEKREQKKLDEEAKKISVYENVPARAFEDIDTVRSNTILEKHKAEPYLVLQQAALKLKADAVVSASCKSFGVGVTCTGVAVRWK